MKGCLKTNRSCKRNKNATLDLSSPPQQTVINESVDSSSKPVAVRSTTRTIAHRMSDRLNVFITTLLSVLTYQIAVGLVSLFREIVLTYLYTNKYIKVVRPTYKSLIDISSFIIIVVIISVTFF